MALGRPLLLLLVAAPQAAARGSFRSRSREESMIMDDSLGCAKCKSAVMRLLVPARRGCPGGNMTLVPSTAPSRVPTAYCDVLLPKKRQCLVYSFGADSVLDFERAMNKRKDPASGESAGCRVVSFDPFCCGAAHLIAPGHSFVPVGLAAFDGMMQAGPEHLNTTFPVMTLRTLMTSLSDSKLDVLRLKVRTALEWKGLKNLIKLGILQEIRQLSLNLHFQDEDMWPEYK
jgi:hypothetical protein